MIGKHSHELKNNFLIAVEDQYKIEGKTLTPLTHQTIITIHALLTMPFMQIFVNPHYFCINLNTFMLKS